MKNFLCIILLFSTNVFSAGKTIEDRVAQFGVAVDQRLLPFFKAASVAYPPAKITLIGLKDERELQLYAADGKGAYHYIRSYPIWAASGDLGPKLREGDRQVPEGLYRIESLNPNSRFHLALRVNYPNAQDRAHAKEDGRKNLGGDIMIHGNAVSIGCLAMGDTAAEELFVLAARTGLRNIQVILSPIDFRKKKLAKLSADLPKWLSPLYASIKAELIKYEGKRSK
jgi:murein L,D-transpeptidase YafK